MADRCKSTAKTATMRMQPWTLNVSGYTLQGVIIIDYKLVLPNNAMWPVLRIKRSSTRITCATVFLQELHWFTGNIVEYSTEM